MINEAEIQAVKQRFGIIGNHPALNHAVQVAMQVAPTDMSIIVTGESGSGKESFSKIIHHLSPRKHNSFIAINCGAIPEGTIDSELFGHEKGSFTGALEARKGYFEVTNGGTIFLDEIAEMPLPTQARLLRVLENGEYIRVGSSKVLKTDVRIIAATHTDLYAAVSKGKFREDLYYRLNSVPIEVPPLRNRGNDVWLLFRKFASDFSEKYRVKPISLTENAQELLKKYSFPGNIRQLKNLVDRISALEMDREIDRETFAHYLPKNHSNSLPALFQPENGFSNENGYSEREILYKILFDMKKDVSELKQMIYESFQDDTDNNQVLRNHKDLFDNMDNELSDLKKQYDTPSSNSLLLNAASSDEYDDDHHTIDLSHDDHADYNEYEDESLSLETKEKELIIKALKKNNNKRKYAAQDLGISERTLYRKIKQYGIN